MTCILNVSKILKKIIQSRDYISLDYSQRYWRNKPTIIEGNGHNNWTITEDIGRNKSIVIECIDHNKSTKYISECTGQKK